MNTYADPSPFFVSPVYAFTLLLMLGEIVIFTLILFQVLGRQFEMADLSWGLQGGKQYTSALEGRSPRYKDPHLLTWMVLPYTVKASDGYCGTAVSSQPLADGLPGIFVAGGLSPWKR